MAKILRPLLIFLICLNVVFCFVFLIGGRDTRFQLYSSLATLGIISVVYEIIVGYYKKKREKEEQQKEISSLKKEVEELKAKQK